jgi:hypothetical protein
MTPLSRRLLSPALPLVCSAAALVPGGAPAQTAPDLKSFQALADKWSVAYAARDQDGLELLLAPTFLDISAAGKISTRNGVLANMVAGTFDGAQLVSIEQKVVDLRLLGPDAAVVDGTYIVHLKAPVASASMIRDQQIANSSTPEQVQAATAGSPGITPSGAASMQTGASSMQTIDERGVFSTIWQRTRLGGWACTHAQRTAVFDEPLAATNRARPGKKSDAELPFHIPLVYGGAASKNPPKPGEVTAPPQ